MVRKTNVLTVSEGGDSELDSSLNNISKFQRTSQDTYNSGVLWQRDWAHWLTWAQGSLPAAEWWHPAQTAKRCHCRGAQTPGWRRSSLLPAASSWRKHSQSPPGHSRVRFIWVLPGCIQIYQTCIRLWDYYANAIMKWDIIVLRLMHVLCWANGILQQSGFEGRKYTVQT